ncbi:hypothetical protein [Nioella nitratireducens]|uniref:hypothetical protein n=1 Tax=Nioella nitratireducens TaxID=1287720 RepID=UPI0008FD6044|nr:hypothetical protein [Nioella nitratireducens]
MADLHELQGTADRLAALMRDKLDVRADSLDRALHQAGRRLPRARRADGALILAALERAQHPRLARVTDGTGAAQAARRIEAWLKQSDPQTRRARARAGLLGEIAFRIFAVLVLLIVVLVWRGGL